MNKKELVYDALVALGKEIMDCNAEISDKLGTSELQVKQFHYLQIVENNENLTFTEFAEILKITKPSVTEIVNKLIKHNCVEKIQSPDDKRIYYIQLTEKGKKITQMKKLSNMKCAENIVKVLNDDDINSFVKIINKITEKN